MNNDTHDYIQKCPNCNRYMTAKQIKHHVCDSQLTSVKEIPIMFYYETVNEDGNKLIVARGYDGILYRLCPLSVYAQGSKSSDDSYHDKKSDEKLPESSSESLKVATFKWLFTIC